MSHFSLYSQFFLGQTNGFGRTVEIWIEFKISSGLWERLIRNFNQVKTSRTQANHQRTDEVRFMMNLAVCHLKPKNTRKTTTTKTTTTKTMKTTIMRTTKTKRMTMKTH